MNRREFLISCAVLAQSAFARAQSGELRRDTNLSAAPPNSWPQFRGSFSLTGISSTTIAPAPKLAWAWEGGEAFDSSPAIVDDVVYAGTATGELVAVGLADGKLRWRYKAGEAIGESSPAVASGRVFIGDLIGVVHAVSVA
jgi:outer membrane protein assembly factor BamB